MTHGVDARLIALLERALERALPGSSVNTLEVWEMIDRGNEFECPLCLHKMGSHDGLRRCHWGWTSWDSSGCVCGR